MDKEYVEIDGEKLEVERPVCTLRGPYEVIPIDHTKYTREIQFRAKRITDGAWVYGHYVEELFPLSEEFRHKIYTGVQYFNVIGETVTRFTGLFDKNNKRVFEGDILAYHLDNFENETIDGVIKYGEFNCSCCDGVYGWYIDGGDIRALCSGWGIDDDERLYIVGNIYDNPELVEEKNNA